MIKLYNLGRKNYRDTLEFQKQVLEKKKNNNIEEDVLILVEHNPIITIGRSGTRKDVLAPDEFLKENNIELLEVERGGKVTYHGPGQMVVYPIFDLKKIEKDIHKIIRRYEEVVIDFLRNYKITGSRKKDFTGVWVGDKKIASIGIAASSWITYHGISININNDVKKHSIINPCGISFENMTSISIILNKDVDFSDACLNMINSFKKEFNSEMIY
jgi:lipoate-protein ligase B